jgi:dTDP-glucose 4,6-dehydratase
LKNILITGGAGFIGSNFIYRLATEKPELILVNLDALTYAGNLENLIKLIGNDHYHFIQGNINDQDLVEKVLNSYEIDTVVNFAAETHVDRSILGPIQFLETNVVGTGVLLEAVRKTWQGKNTDKFRFHHISTDEVFGSLLPGEAPFSDTTQYAPNSPYSASKAASDHLVRAYWHTYGLPVTISNCTNNYGPYQFPEKLIPLMIMNCINGKPLPVYGDGKQIRDWLFVEDHCEAIQLILEQGKVGETYLIGGENQPTNLEIIHQIASILDELLPDSPFKPHDQLIQYVQDRPGHDRRYAMDHSKITSELGWTPKHDLFSGLRTTLEWYLANQNWVKSLTEKEGFRNWINHNYEARNNSQD